jgi:hypothetical protein
MIVEIEPGVVSVADSSVAVKWRIDDASKHRVEGAEASRWCEENTDITAIWIAEGNNAIRLWAASVSGSLRELPCKKWRC